MDALASGTTSQRPVHQSLRLCYQYKLMSKYFSFKEDGAEKDALGDLFNWFDNII